MYSNGQFYGELDGAGIISGSVVQLQASGYQDFRNVPYKWSATVPWNSTWTATQNVNPSNLPGWWFRACGWIGSGTACTDAVKP